MRYLIFVPLFFLLFACTNNATSKLKKFSCNHDFVEKNGRFDKEASIPKVWNSGASIHFKFKGTSAKIRIYDEQRFGTHHNYIMILVDGKAKRIKLQFKLNELLLGENLSDTIHEVEIIKETEANIGYLEFESIICEKLIEFQKKESPEIEFIGDSITAGNGADTTSIACKAGTWYDQHSAYQSYGMRCGRMLNRKVRLSAFSGIGMARSCCGIKFTMPEIYYSYDFYKTGKKFIPDYKPKLIVVTIGQNDGVGNEKEYQMAYIDFVLLLKKSYPNSKFLLCSSPMANEDLQAFQAKNLPEISKRINAVLEESTAVFLYKKSYRGGCDSHPTVDQHLEIAKELLPTLASYFPEN